MLVGNFEIRKVILRFILPLLIAGFNSTLPGVLRVLSQADPNAFVHYKNFCSSLLTPYSVSLGVKLLGTASNNSVSRDLICNSILLRR
jgi:hypothetical protein